MPGDILEAIDGALRDNTVSGDAMRWSPEPEAPKKLAAVGEIMSLTIDTTGFAEAMQQTAAELARFCGDVVKMFAPIAECLAAHDHPRLEQARCSVCNPTANPPPLPVDGHEYQRRLRNRRKRGR